jgi:hypothetical protein
VQTGRTGWAHCVQALSEVGGHDGSARTARVRAGGVGTPRYAASHKLGVGAGGRTEGELVGGARRERTEGLSGASSANCAHAECGVGPPRWWA